MSDEVKIGDVEGVLARCFDDIWEQAERHPDPSLFLARNGFEALLEARLISAETADV